MPLYDAAFAALGYDAYKKELVRRTELTMPTWEELTPAVRRAWTAAATAMLNATADAVLI